VREARHRKSTIPIGRTFAIVVGIHVLGGVGLLFLSQTEAGQKVLKNYQVKLAQKEEAPEPEKPAEPPPPPPPPAALEAEPAAALEASAAATSAPEVASLGGDVGSGALAYGGRFAGPQGGGPIAAFHAAVERAFRRHYEQPEEPFQVAVLELDVSGAGHVNSYRLAKSSGSASNDAAVLSAAQQLAAGGVARPPEGEGRIITVRVVPY
jgi:hypothetical protein